MIRIGITGGVGTGKSACARLLGESGVPVVDTDALARQFTAPGQPALAAVFDRFGSGVRAAHGELDRAALARQVFADAPARHDLEAILHPLIHRAWQAELERLAAAGERVAAVVIPLLFETGVESRFDAVWCVACPEREQLARLAARGWSEEDARRRIAAQWPVAEKIRRASRVIWTDGTLDAHRAQVRRLLAEAGAPAAN